MKVWLKCKIYCVSSFPMVKSNFMICWKKIMLFLSKDRVSAIHFHFFHVSPEL